MCAIKLGYIGNDVNDLRIHEIEEKSYDPIAEIKGINADFYSKTTLLRDMAVISALNNKAGLRYENNEFQKLGEPTEAALKVAVEKLGQYDTKFGKVDRTKEPEAYSKYLAQTIKKVATLDFTSERKTMSTVVTGFSGQGNSLLLKGAPERVIEKCATYKNVNGEVKELSAADKTKLTTQIQKYAEQGLRILAVGAIYDGGVLRDLNANNVEARLSDI
jgi:magnesium-transporting ATPase (P-type)